MSLTRNITKLGAIFRTKETINIDEVNLMKF